MSEQASGKATGKATANDELVRESNPGTEPFVPDFDTGEHPEYDAGEPSVPFVPDFDTDSQPFLAPGTNTDAPRKTEPTIEAAPEPPVTTADAPATTETTPGPVTVPGRYVYLKWWKLVLVLLGVWFVAGVFGLSLYYWWHHSIDRTPSVFVMFGYVVATTVGGLILAMVESKSLIAALAIAVMSAPCASVSAAAPLYGYFYCQRATTTCLFGVLPY